MFIIILIVICFLCFNISSSARLGAVKILSVQPEALINVCQNKHWTRGKTVANANLYIYIVRQIFHILTNKFFTNDNWHWKKKTLQWQFKKPPKKKCYLQLLLFFWIVIFNSIFALSFYISVCIKCYDWKIGLLQKMFKIESITSAPIA